MVGVVHARSGTRSNRGGFSPWEQWTPESTVCFHDRIAEGIKDKVLSADKIAAVVLRLLNRANEISLAILKEVRYADAPQMCDFNVASLIKVQQHISKARDLLKGRGVDDLPTGLGVGDVMLRMSSKITNDCYVAMTSLHMFYYDSHALLQNVNHAYVAQVLVLLTNTVDAIQQCNFSVYPHEYAASDHKDLESALRRADQALRIVVNALHSSVIPYDNERTVLVERSNLLINTSLLISTFRLLDMAARRAFSKHRTNHINMLHDVNTVQNCCACRVLMLREKIKRYVREARKKNNERAHQAFCNAAWAIDRTYDEIYAIASGTYSDVAGRMHYAAKMSLDIAECVTILSLLRVAYESTEGEDSNIAKVLEQQEDMACGALLNCIRLERTKESCVSGTKKLQEMLICLESVGNGLRAVDLSRLPYQQWSSTMLTRAVKCVDDALDACIATLKHAHTHDVAMRTRYKNMLAAYSDYMLRFSQETPAQMNTFVEYERRGGYCGDGRKTAGCIAFSHDAKKQMSFDACSIDYPNLFCFGRLLLVRCQLIWACITKFSPKLHSCSIWP
ncbi:hypothetical protein [Candidatus Anaplasma sp. TIGMIC]|uniref:hypothetical protein n=1 Tax=Candidatus Anaplasma sp. TIGMIC TaxID=3020713 RepID=UPI00232B5B79|nr:hypothetical protein [Candidatus Anaplasma sp. TIGMIC]MDB1135397.1 hypothetical protein [Candidatus Anaplasma sp. TIGMIC]